MAVSALRALLLAWVVLFLPEAGWSQLRVQPAKVLLDRPEASQQLLVVEQQGKRSFDRTQDVSYVVPGTDIVTVEASGFVLPRGEGHTIIEVHRGSDKLVVPVEVRGLSAPPAISFEHEIIPILTKSRCNSGSCHGKAEGKNGFRLSVFGFDPAADYEALTKESRARRVFRPDVERSLILQKGTARIPHGGGRKIAEGGLAHQRLVRWIAEGARFQGDALPVTRMEVEPGEAVLLAGERQQLQVTAIDSAGRRRCVTREAEYESNATPIAEIDPTGLIQAHNVPGAATVLVRYMGHVAVCRVTSPRPGVHFNRPATANFIDELVLDNLEGLGIEPSELCDDATFLRRVYLDAIGTLPTTNEARGFLDDRSPDKRARLIDQLLNREEYATFWTMRWADLLRVDRDKASPQGAVAMTRWLHREFAENRPYDEFVRAILTAQGDVSAESPASFSAVCDTPEEISRSISQLFLGVRIDCARCHHHPFEKWGQEDYFGLTGFFTGVSKKSLPGGNTAIVSRGGADLKHPRTGALVATRALAAPPADFRGIVDRRRILADWMTSADNPYFAKAIVNRLWAHYFGRGLVEPVDDLRATNPAVNEPLLAKLEAHLREVRFDLKAFTRTLLNSRTYQLSSVPKGSSAADEQSFAVARNKPLAAEVLLDAICQATDVPEKFPGWPAGYRAIEIWDNRMPSYFFTIFGRPVRASVCECERSNEPSITQALHLMNSPEILDKIHASAGLANRLSASAKTPTEIIDELCLATLSRLPTGRERALFLESFSTFDRRPAAEDVLWTLLNSKEFLYNH